MNWYLMSKDDEGKWNSVMSFDSSVAQATIVSPVDATLKVLVVHFNGTSNSEAFKVEFGQTVTINPQGLVA